jgi:hypothetical protein
MLEPIDNNNAEVIMDRIRFFTLAI